MQVVRQVSRQVLNALKLTHSAARDQKVNLISTILFVCIFLVSKNIFFFFFLSFFFFFFFGPHCPCVFVFVFVLRVFVAGKCGALVHALFEASGGSGQRGSSAGRASGPV